MRELDDARAFLEAGADKVSVNSAAVAEPRLVAEIARRFGSQCASSSPLGATPLGRPLPCVPRLVFRY